MTLRVRLVIPARNEALRLGRLLDSVRHGLAQAAALGARWQTEVVVVLDRCRDATGPVAAAWGAEVGSCPAPFGKVEALRAGLSDTADIHVCIDADVVLGARTLFDLVETLQQLPDALAACPPLSPEPLTGFPTALAWALHRYNAARGFSSERLWLSGRCYALRRVSFPTPAEMIERAARVPAAQTFRGLAAPLVADDIWLSRALLAHGPGAIQHVQTDAVSYRAPSSLRGMSRTYRRLRRELMRIDRLFPELPAPGRDRQIDSVPTVQDWVALSIFRTALAACRVHAWLEDRRLAWTGTMPDVWPVVEESKT